MRKIRCLKCEKDVIDNWYTLSDLTKGLWIKCSDHGSMAIPYIANLPLEYRPSKTYKRAHPEINFKNYKAIKTKVKKEKHKKKLKTILPLQVKNPRTRESYRQYLQTDHWIRFRKRIYGKCKQCCFCGTKENLNIHHLTYRNLYREKLKDVVVLCQKDHYAFHDKLFTSSQENMIKQNMLIAVGKMKKPKEKKIKKFLAYKPQKNAKLPETPEQKEMRLIRKMGTIKYYYLKRNNMLRAV